MARLLGCVLLCALACPASGQELARVEEVDWPALRTHVQHLLRGLGQLKAPLPPETERPLRELLAQQAPPQPEAAATAVQKLLDPHCLLGVHINPESRVKAARGRAAADLKCDRETVVLVKVHNDGGVTHALDVSGPQLLGERKPAAGRWLQAGLAAPEPLSRKLSGQRLEYALLRLTPRERGKREATFRFDVGQGTQDLGFRAEVPILFTVGE